MGDEPFDGLIVLVALARPEGGVHFLEVWESQEAYEAGHRDRIGPAVTRMLAEHGIPTDGADAPPDTDAAPSPVFEVLGLVLGAGAAAAITR